MCLCLIVSRLLTSGEQCKHTSMTNYFTRIRMTHFPYQSKQFNEWQGFDEFGFWLRIEGPSIMSRVQKKRKKLVKCKQSQSVHKKGNSKLRIRYGKIPDISDLSLFLFTFTLHLHTLTPLECIVLQRSVTKC